MEVDFIPQNFLFQIQKFHFWDNWNSFLHYRVIFGHADSLVNYCGPIILPDKADFKIRSKIFCGMKSMKS